MELHLEQQQISSFSLRVQRTTEERFSTDCVVPDSLPDAASLLLTEGELCLWRLDLDEGSAELEGEVSARVCYQGENGEIAGFPVSAPVTVRFRAEDLQRSFRPVLRCRVTELNSQLLNSRKIRLQGRLFCSLSCYAPQELCLTTEIGSGEKGLFCRREHNSLSVVSSVEEQVFAVSETVPLRMGFPEDGRLLSCRSAPLLDDTQILDSRVILQGRVVTTLLYQDAQRGAVVSETVETPFSQLVDVSSDHALQDAEAVLHLTSEEIRCSNDDPAIETDIHLVAQIVCYSRLESDCVTDAYSTRGDLKLTWTEESLSAVPQEPHRIDAEGVVACDGAGKSLVAARAALRGDRAEVTLLLSDDAGVVTPVSGQLSLPEPMTGLLSLEAPVVSSCAEGYAVRVPVLFRDSASETEAFRQISGAEYEPMDGADLRPGLKLVRCTNTDLWTLAKAHASSVEAIRAANPESDPPSRWLLIPRVI